jgi:hypothetical protein
MGKSVNCQQLIEEARRVSLETALEATLELDALETTSTVAVADHARKHV